MSSADLENSAMLGEPTVPRLSTLRYARKFGVALVLIALIFGGASFVVLLGLTPIEPSSDIIVAVSVINALFVLIMTVLVGREVSALLKARKRGRAAARMHIRIVGLFGVVAAFPAIVVAIVAGISLDSGLERIFDQRTRNIVSSSIQVAESYVAETAATLNSHTINMGFLLMRNRPNYILDRRNFEQYLSGQARARGLVKAEVVRSDGSTIVAADLPKTTGTALPPPPPALMKQALDGKPACGGPKIRNLAGCIIKLPGLGQNEYLYTLRTVNENVVNSIDLMEEITQEYRLLESGRLPLQLAFGLLYFGICLTVLLSAIWMGIAVADRLVAPVRRLITAADEVAAGNLGVTVPVGRSEGEFRSLESTFNSMTSELRTQRDEILETQELIDQRRRFTEAVLSGVSAGVIGVGAEGRLAIANSSAMAILGNETVDLIGTALCDVSPELSAVVENAEKAGRSDYREQITLTKQGSERTLNVQVTVDNNEDETHSHVITIDDITDLVSAQRTSAWADVARRIAHEIKNPLTPIQLSAERIKRRYGKVITEDREVFDQCTDTIVRQVADIGRMVDEFSSFARMPKPTKSKGDLRDTIREAVFLLKVSHPEIDFDVKLGEKPLHAMFDSRLLGQAFGNLIKNATEAMEGVTFKKTQKPRIQVASKLHNDFYQIDIIDNGKGLPEENRQRLLEPYMTTREKGTGLGLAIVGKILEEHNGSIELMDAPAVSKGGRGAMMRVLIPSLGAEPERITSETEEGVTHGV